MRSRIVALLAGLVLVTAVAGGAARAAGASPASLPFSPDLDAALQDAAASGKPVVVAFVAAWCPVCATMKRSTFRDPRVLDVSGDFLWVQIDIDRNLTTARDYEVLGVPQMLLIDPGGRLRARLQGMVVAEDLRTHLQNLLGAPEPPGGGPPEPEHTTHGPQSALIYTPGGYRGLSICFSHVGYGPLRLNSQSPFQVLRLGIRPRTPSTLGKGQFDVRVTSTWVNVWAVDEEPGSAANEFFLDFEMLQSNVSLAYGLSDTLEIEAEVQNRSRFGGHMDGFIQGFHDWFGIEQNGRDQVAKGLFRFELDPPNGDPGVSLARGERGTFSRNLQVSLQHNVTCGTARLPAFSYSVTARAGNSEDLSGGNELDLGVSVALARRFGKFYVYGTLGYARFGQDEFHGIDLADTQATVLAAGEWRFLPRHSLLLQYLLSEGVLEDFVPFSDASNEITLGWKWEMVERGTLEVGIIENVVSFDNSPDFGLHVGYSQRF